MRKCKNGCEGASRSGGSSGIEGESAVVIVIDDMLIVVLLL